MARSIASGAPNERPGREAQDEGENNSIFDPTVRAAPEEVVAQVAHLMSRGLLSSLLDVVPVTLTVMNRHQQVLSMNASALAAMGIKEPAEYLGLGPGEAYDCIHAFDVPAGCGASASCPHCGGYLAAEVAEREIRGIFECQILSAHDAGDGGVPVVHDAP